jgi:hypothetical protein
MVERAGIAAGLPITHPLSAFLARFPKILARDHKTVLRKVPARLGLCVGARKSF